MKVCVVLACLLAPVACGPAEPETGGGVTESVGRPVVAAVNYPLAFFAERIGGDAVRVELPLLEGDPAFWNPPVEAIVAFQQAAVILRNGAGYAGWVDRASLPASRMVDTSAAFRERLIAVDGGVTHAHGPQGEHEHGGTAFTTWLDMARAVEQARAVRGALTQLLPEEKAALEKRFANLERDLLAFDRRLAGMIARAPDRPLIGSHPVYQYLAARYGLNLISVHWEPAEIPDPAMWGELEGVLLAHPARWMLWEGEPRAETVAGLRALGVESVVFDPCGNRPVQGDFMDVMQRNGTAFERVFEDGDDSR